MTAMPSHTRIPPANLAQEMSGGPALAASFNRAAQTYGERPGVQAAMAGWLSEWLPPAHSGRVLEVGAGTGLFTGTLFPWNGPVTASDLSPEMCRVGRTCVPQAKWIQMDAGHPTGGPWEWILSCSMLQWVADPSGVFTAWRDCLAPGGRALGGVLAAGSLAEWNALAGDASPLAWRSPEEWRSHLSGAGFRLLRDQAEKRVFRYPSAIALLRSLHDVGGAPHRRYAAGRLRRHLRDYDERFRSPGGVGASWMFYRFEVDLGEPPGEIHATLPSKSH